MVKIQKAVGIEYDWVVMGKFMINKYFLKQNKLLIKYATYSPIPWLKQQPIDDIFKEFWQELIHTNTVSYGLLKQCSIEQLNLVYKIFEKARVIDHFKFDIDKAKLNYDDIKERMEILQGELRAGNNNPKIIQEAKNIINKLFNIDKITEKQRNELLSDLTDI